MTTLLPDPSATNLIKIKNKGAATAQITMFQTLALSDQISVTKNNSTIITNKRGQQTPTPDIKAVSYHTVTTPSCSQSQTAIQVAITTWDRITFMGNIQLIIKYNYTSATDGMTKTTRIYSKPVTNGVAAWTSKEDNLSPTRRFFVQHATNSANVVLTACIEDVASFFEDRAIVADADVMAVVRARGDFFDGLGDEVAFRFAPFRKAFAASGAEWDVVSGGGMLLPVAESMSWGGGKCEGTSLGVALLSDSYRDEGHTGAATKETELLLILKSGVEEPVPVVGADNRLR